MCEVSTVFLVASMVVTAAAGVYDADTRKKAGQYEAEVAEQNAKLDDFRAEQAGQIGAIREEQKRAQVREAVGSQRATLAANGVDLGSGTAQDMVAETTAMGEADALTIRFNAMNEAWGYRTQAVNERNGGKFAKWSANRQAMGTYLSTAGSLMSMGSGLGGGGAASSSSYGAQMATVASTGSTGAAAMTGWSY